MFWYPHEIIPEFYDSAILKEYGARHKGLLEIPWYAQYVLNFLKTNNINVQQNNKLLDIGCGDGHISLALSDMGFCVVGIELDSKSADIAKLKGINVYTELFDENLISVFKAKQLKFEAASFFEVLEHQDNPRQFISDVLKVLDKDGIFFGTVPNRQRIGNFIIRYLLKRNKLKLHFELPPHHFLWWDRKSLYAFLASFPVSKIHIDAIYFPYIKRVEWYNNYLKLIPYLGKIPFFVNAFSKVLAIPRSGFGQHLFFYVSK